MGAALRLSFARARREGFKPEPEPPPLLEVDATAPHAELEELTAYFRRGLARRHLDRAKEEARAYRDALERWAVEDAPAPLLEDAPSVLPRGATDARTVDALRDAVSSRRWHLARARGQRERFAKVRGCGARVMVAACKSCGTERKPVHEACGVRRVCPRCDVAGASERRARFGRARGRVLVDAHRYGLFRKVRRGGAYSEKMLTLTVPHFGIEDASGVVRAESRDTLHARISAAFRAWPVFLRRLNRWFKGAGAEFVALHRSFEWTPGKDGEGHPHFHVWLWCPFVDVWLIRAWWAEALRSVGWRVDVDDEDRDVIRVDLRRLRSVNVAAVRELMKGGRRSALTLSRVEFASAKDADAWRAFMRGAWRDGASGPGMDAFSYAEGWTIGDVKGCAADVVARLYMALEGRRLTQASSGFFVDDEPAACECCGASFFLVRFEAARAWGLELPPLSGSCQGRGPPS